MEASRKEQVFIVTAVFVLIIGGVAFGVAQFLYMGPPPPLPRPTLTAGRSVAGGRSGSLLTAPVTAISDTDRARVMAVYHLENDQAVKYIAPPFIPERAAAMQPIFNFRSSAPLSVMILDLSPEGQLRLRSGSSSPGFPVSSLLQVALGVDSSQIDALPSLKSMQVNGDWIIRSSADVPQKAAGLSTALTQALGKKVSVDHSQAERPVIVISGTYKFKPLEDAMPDSQVVELFFDAREATPSSSGQISTSSLASMLSSYTGSMFVNEISPQRAAQPIRLAMYRSFTQARTGGGMSSGQIQHVIELLSEQTGLDFKTTQRMMDVYNVSTE